MTKTGDTEYQITHRLGEGWYWADTECTGTPAEPTWVGPYTTEKSAEYGCSSCGLLDLYKKHKEGLLVVLRGRDS